MVLPDESPSWESGGMVSSSGDGDEVGISLVTGVGEVAAVSSFNDGDTSTFSDPLSWIPVVTSIGASVGLCSSSVLTPAGVSA